MGGIDKQDRSLAAPGLVEPWLKLVGQELLLLLDVGFGRNSTYLAVAQVETFFKNWRTWVRPRLTPVNCSMTA